MLVDDHTGMNNELKGIVSCENITPPTSVSSEQRQTIDRFAKLSGHQFDRKFLKDSAKDHRDDIREFEKEAANGQVSPRWEASQHGQAHPLNGKAPAQNSLGRGSPVTTLSKYFLHILKDLPAYSHCFPKTRRYDGVGGSMISERQLEANRRNAAKSHGPITPEGRAAVRLNALQHGLTAAEVILPTTEDKLEFEQFQASFVEECQPVGPIEQVLVEDIVVNRWRMTRVRKMEPGFFALRLQALEKWIIKDHSALDAQAHLALVFRDDAENSDTLGKMSRYEARFERSFHKALKELQRLQALRAAASDSGNGTVSQNPVSPDPDPLPPPESAPPPAQGSSATPIIPADPPTSPEIEADVSAVFDNRPETM
jgi:hypothetical protein